MSKDIFLLRQPAVVVVGSGRCGTSSVAQLCHKELGISMGIYLKHGDELNPDGYYEDLISHALVRAMVAGDNRTYCPEMYLQIMNALHKEDLAWGVKDPWFLYLSRDYLIRLKPKLCVIATRDLDSTVRSWLKVWRAENNMVTDPPKNVVDYYKQLTLDREAKTYMLQQIWPNIVTIDFTKHVPDEEIMTAVRYGLASASHLK